MIVRIWDMGLLRAWIHAMQRGGAGKAFAAHVLKQTSQGELTIMALDREGTTSRHAILPSYKANRPKKTEEERAVIFAETKAALHLLEDHGVRVRWSEGWEADDVIATVASSALLEGHTVRVYSSDKDLIQLLPLGLRLHNTRTEIDAARVREKFGVEPRQFLDYLSIVGDSSDGVPGGPGLGPIFARKLLAEHASLDAALEAAERDASPRDLSRLLAARADILLSRDVIRLNLNVPLRKGQPEEFR